MTLNFQNHDKKTEANWNGLRWLQTSARQLHFYAIRLSDVKSMRLGSDQQTRELLEGPVIGALEGALFAKSAFAALLDEEDEGVNSLDLK